MKHLKNLLFIGIMAVLLFPGLCYALPDDNTGIIIPPISQGWRLSETVTEQYVNNDWVNNQRKIYYYNPVYRTNIDSICTQSYNFQTSSWYTTMVRAFQYDATHQYITDCSIKMLLLRDTFPYWKIHFTYDNVNKLIQITDKVFEPDMDYRFWEDVKRTYFTYSNNTISQIICWDATLSIHPHIYVKTDLEADYLGRVITETTQTALDSLTWINHKKIMNSYYVNDNTTGAIIIQRIAKELPLNYAMGDDFEYGMYTENITQTWWENSWQNSYRDSYTYTTDIPTYPGLTPNLRSINSHKREQWLFGGGWANLENHLFSFCPNGNLNQILFLSWDMLDTQWLYVERTSCCWEELTANNDNVSPAISEINLSVYPNPFNENFNIAVRSKSLTPIKVLLYNVRGQAVYETRMLPNTNLTLNSKSISDKLSSSGVYFLKVTQGSNSKCRKIIRLK